MIRGTARSCPQALGFLLLALVAAVGDRTLGGHLFLLLLLIGPILHGQPGNSVGDGAVTVGFAASCQILGRFLVRVDDIARFVVDEP